MTSARWTATGLARRLGIDLPILQAPMAGVSGPELAAAVANAGGLGSLGTAILSPDELDAAISAFRRLSNRAVNVNFFCHETPTDPEPRSEAMRTALAPLYAARGLGPVPPASVPRLPFSEDHAEVLERRRPEIVSFHFGLPAPALLDRVRATGAILLCSATTPAEAIALEAAGIDAVIAQGLEAGGHRGTFLDASADAQLGLFTLLPQVVDAVGIPVIAAGGIADGRGIAAALCLGAEAVQIGTAFLRCPEARTHPAHRQALAEGRDSRVTRLFSGRPARSLVNRFLRETAPLEAVAAPFPVQLSLTGPLAAAAPPEEAADWMPLWAGQAAGLARALPAAELVAALARETDAVLGVHGDPEAP